MIVFHADWYPGDPWQALNGAEHSGRFEYYPITLLPTLMVDGLLDRWPITPALLTTAVNNRLAVDSPISIDISSSAAPTSIDANIEVNSANVAVSGNYKIRFAIANNFYDGWTGSNGMSEWHYDMLDMAPDDNGLAFSIGTNETLNFDVSFNWPLSVNGDPITVDNLSIIVYVQNDNTHEVIQSNMALVGGGEPDPVTLALTPQVDAIPQGGGNVVYDVQFTNNTDMSANGLRYRTYVTLPDGSRVGPLANIAFNMAPFMDVTYTGLTQAIPGNAPAGEYLFIATAGVQNNPDLQVMDSFMFAKAGVDTDGEFVFDPSEWSDSDFTIAGDALNSQLPSEYAMNAAYPNPFNPSTTVSVSLPEAAELTVSVYNVNGQQVASLHQGVADAGTHSLTFDATGLSSGLYFVHATVPGHLDHAQKVMLVR
jgi:Secretion system C-terminal sorting domain